MLAAVAGLFLAAPVRGQDDDNAPPPPDNGASVPPDNGAAAPDESAPSDGASFQTFYDSLGSQGTWIQTNDYGYVWQPQVNDPEWAPYTAGHWVYTDDGWTWVSDEPWGWATYHYGRWVNLDGSGWCWVPGYTWAPAWVSWRYGGGFCGWAPLPPDSFLGIDYYGDNFAFGIGFHIGGDCDGFYGIGPGCYTFLPVIYLGYSNYHGYYRNRRDNFALINHTTNVTNINVTRNGANARGATAGGGFFHHVTTGGPSLAQVNAVSQTPLQRMSLVRTGQPGGGGTLANNSLALFAPHVNPGGTARPSRVAGSIGQATINRGTDIMRPLAVNSHLMPSAATEAQVQQARIAQNHVPPGAKVVTDSASVKPILQQPLTSLQPTPQPTVRQAAPSHIFSTSPNGIFNTERVEHAPSASENSPGNAPGTTASPETRASRTYSPAPSSPTVTSTPAPSSVRSTSSSASGNTRSGGNSGSGGGDHSSSGGGSSGGSSHGSGGSGSSGQQGH